MSQPPDKREPPQPEQHDSVWPPPPKTPQPIIPSSYPVIYFTGLNWLDAIMGIPSGFIIGAVSWSITGSVFDLISKPPSHRPKMLAVCFVGLALTSVFYYLVQRKHSLFGFTMWLGGIPFYLLMFFLAWCVSS